MKQMQVDQVVGVRLTLRLARPTDAAFIFNLRTDPAYNQHLSAVSGTVEDQAEWLRRYVVREAAGKEYYYVIWRRDSDQPCGVVRLYEIEGDHLTWGSWILQHNKTPKAALESAVLSYEVAFEKLGLARSRFDARIGNTKAVAFYRRFGAIEVGRDNRDIFFEFTAEQFEKDKERHMSVLRGDHTVDDN